MSAEVSASARGARSAALTGAWGMVGAAVMLSGAYAVLAYLVRTVSFHAYGYLGAIPIDCLSFAILGALVAARLPRNPIGWLFGAIGIILLTTSVAQLYAVRGLIVRPGSLPAPAVAGWLGSWLWGPGVGLTVAVVPLLFPDGHPPGRRWRRYARVAIAVVLFQALVAAAATIPDKAAKLDLSGQYLSSQTGFRVAIFSATYLVLVPLAVGSVASLFRRRVDADAVARQPGSKQRREQTMNATAELNHQVKRIQRREFLKAAGAVGAAGVAAALVVPAEAAAADNDRGGPLGTWLETITSPDGSFPSFQTLFTFSSGGGLVGTASIDDASGLKSSPTHGIWTVRGRQITRHAHAFSFDDSGNLNGFYNITDKISVDIEGDAYSGSGTFEVVNGPGAFGPLGYKVTAVRITS